MLYRLTKRLLREVHWRLLFRFVFTFAWKGRRAVSAFKRRVKQGTYVPAFLFISVTDRCNLACQGCWMAQMNPPRELSSTELDRIITEQKSYNSHFFGLLGGEPLLHQNLFDVIALHPDCYFQVFTNGTLLTDVVAAEMRRLGNVTPLISIEGKAEVSDVRRGGHDVFRRSLQGLENCRRHKLVTGVSTSLCRSNLDELASEEFISEMVDRGVHYLWYYIYRPAGADPAPELALSRDEIVRARRFMVEARRRFPILIVDAYWDDRGRALCPAASGISHHIGPGGDIEPCPPIQFATDSVQDGQHVPGKVAQSDFLQGCREMACRETRGCVLLECPQKLGEYIEQADARNTSGRTGEREGLLTRHVLPGHHVPGEEIPEQHWLYRFAKKHWFFGFGAYG